MASESSVKLDRRSLARIRRSANQAGHRRLLTVCDFSLYGCRCLYRSMDIPYAAQGYILRLHRPDGEETPDRLGAPRWRSLGSRQYTYGLCNSGCWTYGRFSLWNANALVGLFWARILFRELKGASGRQHRQGRCGSNSDRDRGRPARVKHGPRRWHWPACSPGHLRRDGRKPVMKDYTCSIPQRPMSVA